MNQRFYKSSELSKNDATVMQPNGGVSLKILEGFFTTVQILGGRPLLLIDFVSRILRNESLYDVMRPIKGEDIVRQAVRGKQVIAKYGTHRMYRIVDVDFTKTPLSLTEHDPSITYLQYFENTYGIGVRDKGQPLVLGKTRASRSVYLVPELLRTTGLTDQERSNGKLMVEVAETTKKEPNDRNQLILNCARDLRGDFQSEGYKLYPVRNLEGLVLHPPQIRTQKWEQVDQRRNITLNKLLKPSVLQSQKWLLIYKSTCDDDEQDIDEIVIELQKAATKLGAKFADPYLMPMPNYTPKTWSDALKEEIDVERPVMVLSVLYEKGSALYQQLKNLLLMVHGIPHQNMQPAKLLKSKNRQAQALKIVQQMNVKLGCAAWQVEMPQGISQKIMLVGLDVYHKTIVGKRSVAGFVASMDSAITQFWSTTIILNKGQELTHTIAGYFGQALQEYRRKNNFLPETIIFYRDGVGDSQINAVYQVETKAIISVITAMAPKYTPAFAQLLINKRIHHRFFTGEQQVRNPPSGTLVANTVVEEGYSFKLIAQNVTSGTATPTHYQLIHNTTDWKEETFWQLTYWQCFNYANWQGAVRVPAVVQYAHKLAYMVGETIQQQVNGDIIFLLIKLIIYQFF